MESYLAGIGWVTGQGVGWGSKGGTFSLPELPLPALTRKDVFPEKNQRFGRMSDYAKLGLAAIAFALRDAGLEAWEAKRAIGVVASTRLGCLATDLEYQRTVLLQGGGLASPNLFAYTLANCFLGDAAIQFGLTGSSIAINDPAPDGLGSLRMALEEIGLGEARTMLAGVCDLAAPTPWEGGEPFGPGALFLVLTKMAPEGSGYGRVRLLDDGSVTLAGTPVGSLVALVETALKP